MRGLDRIAPKTGIDKNFAQFEFYDLSQAKSRVEWATRQPLGYQGAEVGTTPLVRNHQRFIPWSERVPKRPDPFCSLVSFASSFAIFLWAASFIQACANPS
jgi:hypothetical protein